MSVDMQVAAGTSPGAGSDQAVGAVEGVILEPHGQGNPIGVRIGWMRPRGDRCGWLARRWVGALARRRVGTRRG